MYLASPADVLKGSSRVPAPVMDRSLFMQRGEGGKKKRGGLKAISDWLDVGAKLFYTEVYKLFYKDVQGGQQFDREVHVKRGQFAKMGKAVKQKGA